MNASSMPRTTAFKARSSSDWRGKCSAMHSELRRESEGAGPPFHEARLDAAAPVGVPKSEPLGSASERPSSTANCDSVSESWQRRPVSPSTPHFATIFCSAASVRTHCLKRGSLSVARSFLTSRDASRKSSVVTVPDFNSFFILRINLSEKVTASGPEGETKWSKTIVAILMTCGLARRISSSLCTFARSPENCFITAANLQAWAW
mmetsp:Transcript_18383/g.61951  ORF Transcript_18383/g.61951 Transcript_18383/m.61951 type:complete len:206 (-) Transcript_18383:352-969(-)